MNYEIAKPESVFCMTKAFEVLTKSLKNAEEEQIFSTGFPTRQVKICTAVDHLSMNLVELQGRMEFYRTFVTEGLEALLGMVRAGNWHRCSNPDLQIDAMMDFLEVLMEGEHEWSDKLMPSKEMVDKLREEESPPPFFLQLNVGLIEIQMPHETICVPNLGAVPYMLALLTDTYMPYETGILFANRIR